MIVQGEKYNPAGICICVYLYWITCGLFLVVFISYFRFSRSYSRSCITVIINLFAPLSLALLCKCMILVKTALHILKASTPDDDWRNRIRLLPQWVEALKSEVIEGECFRIEVVLFGKHIHVLLM